jgi:hypothetical protein
MIATGAGLCLLLIVVLTLGALALRSHGQAVAEVSTVTAPPEVEPVPVAAEPIVAVEPGPGSAKSPPMLPADAANRDAPFVKLAEANAAEPFATVKTPPREEEPAPVVAVNEPAPPAVPLIFAQRADTGTCGTSVAFVSSPKLAAQRAREEEKLLFILHVSGNFEDPGFT